MNRRLNLLAVNMNPMASTRQGLSRIARALHKHFHVRVQTRHFPRLTPSSLREADAVILGPQGTPFDAYGESLRTLFEVVEMTRERPTLGICGGCQAMVLAAGGEIGPLRGGIATQTYDGLEKQVGWRTIEAVMDSPLLTVGNTATVHVSHVEATTVLPPPYLRLAASDYCDVQMIGAPDALRFGVQFHPEYGRDGIGILERFMRLV